MATASVPAAADSLDPALERLVTADTQACVTQTASATAPAGSFTGVMECAPDNVAFKKLINQYAFAFAPTAMHSARTTGFGGFHLSLEGVYTKIDDDAEYWQKGTRGPVDATENRAATRNDDPPSILQLYSVKLRKSFGFGFELTGAVGFMPNTNIVSGGADVRLSLLEGFRRGIPGVLPDLAVGGGVRSVTGTPQFQLTVAGLDAQVSKPFPVADSSVLTPWIGFQYLWIFGDSGLIDLTPATDAVQYCNYAGDDLGPGGDADGQPTCQGGSPVDFNNNTVFRRVRLERQRLMFGVNYRFEVLMLGGQFITDLVDPEDAQNSDQDTSDLAGEDRQWSIVLELGGVF